MADDVTFAPLRKETAAQVSSTLQQLLSDVSALVAWAEEHDSPEAATLVRTAVAEVMVVALGQLGRPLMGVWDEVLPDRLKSHLATAVEPPALGDAGDEEISTDEHEAIS
jgi:hypothetical protein